MASAFPMPPELYKLYGPVHDERLPLPPGPPPIELAFPQPDEFSSVPLSVFGESTTVRHGVRLLASVSLMLSRCRAAAAAAATQFGKVQPTVLHPDVQLLHDPSELASVSLRDLTNRIGAHYVAMLKTILSAPATLPGAYADMAQLFANAHHLVHSLRVREGRVALAAMMRDEIARKDAATRRITEAQAGLAQRANEAAAALAAASWASAAQAQASEQVAALLDEATAGGRVAVVPPAWGASASLAVSAGATTGDRRVTVPLSMCELLASLCGDLAS